MAIGQAVVLVLEGVCVAVDNKSSNIAAVFFVFLYETCFTWGTYMHSAEAGRLLSCIAVCQGGWRLCGCTLRRSCRSRFARRVPRLPPPPTSWGTSSSVTHHF